ncbi:predicted protein [Chaetoceros tenuissimus]|uniref:Uncharacterized protein n=1 Tax=Chaetoceros tenuissimus TaxID=426638 RepID=A0AAD3CPB7_9STRA|nr:predicted protein [Chaetoceros tenuissimus]
MMYARAPSFEILCMENDLRFSFYEPDKGEAVKSLPTNHRNVISSAIFIPFELPRCPSFEILSSDNTERFSFYHAATNNRSQEEIVTLRDQDNEETQSCSDNDDYSLESRKNESKSFTQEKIETPFEQKYLHCEKPEEDSWPLVIGKVGEVVCEKNESNIVCSSTPSRQMRFSFYKPEACECSPMPTYYVNENFQLTSEFARCESFDILDPHNEKRFSFYEALNDTKLEEAETSDKEKKQALSEVEGGEKTSNTANIPVDDEGTNNEIDTLYTARQIRFRFYEPVQELVLDHHIQNHVVDTVINENVYAFARCPTFEILSPDNEERFSFYDSSEVKKMFVSQNDDHCDQQSTSHFEDSCSIFEDERVDEPAETSTLESCHLPTHMEERAPSVCDERAMISIDSFRPSNNTLGNKDVEQYLAHSLSDVARVYGNKMEEDAECMSCHSDHNEGKDAQKWAIQSKTEIAALQNFIDTQFVEGQGCISSEYDISQSFSIGTAVAARNIDNVINEVDDFCSEVEVRIDNIMKDTKSYDE